MTNHSISLRRVLALTAAVVVVQVLAGCGPRDQTGPPVAPKTPQEAQQRQQKEGN